MEQYEQKGRQGPGGKSKERLFEALELACKFYQAQFAHSKTALEYALKKRAFSKETALEWRLGYSPNNGRALVDFLKSKGFTQSEIRLAGLTNQRGSDMFRGRLQIPLCDPSGRVIGFTARLLVDDPQAPKYINTPSTPLYDKSRHVFGLHLAKEAIRKGGFAVLAEGNLDVIQSHQAGVRQVAATAGTALTEYHLKALSRLTGDIRLSFDADRAGVDATERAIPIAAKVNVQLSVITIPSGKDPDELIKQDVQIWRDIITRPQYAVDWLIDRYASQLDLDTAVGKRRFSDVVLKVVRQLPDPVEQDHYLSRLAELLQVNKAALATKLSTVESEMQPVRLRAVQSAPHEKDAISPARLRTEKRLIALSLRVPKLRHVLDPVSPEMFLDVSTQKVYRFIIDNPGRAFTDDEMEQKFPEYDTIYEETYRDVDFGEQMRDAHIQRSQLINDYVETEKAKNNYILQTLGDDATAQFYQRDAELNKLLKDYGKGGQY